MKRKLLYIILLGSIGIGSCKKDFLNLYPETVVNSASFYKTAKNFDQATIAAYIGLRTMARSGVFMDEMRSDNTFYTRYSFNNAPYLTTEVISLFLNAANTGSGETSWAWINNRYAGDYTCISRVNAIIARIDGAEITQDQKNSVLAEALFLRAFYYFDLVQHWGPVPLMLNEVTSDAEAFEPNSTVEAIYSQIIKDVSEAIQLGLPVPQTFPQSGRATLGAAKMLLAYAYMSKPTREYAKAETALIDITKMNYGLLDNYADVFRPENKNSKESIFEVQYKEGTDGQNSDFCFLMMPKCTNPQLIVGIGTTYSVLSGWSVPTQEMIDSYESGDKRLHASVAVAEGTVQYELLTVEAVKDIVGYTPTIGKDYFYFVTKYCHPPYILDFNSGDNFPIYRYSGALLLLAECLVNENKAVEALPYLNLVRSRAGLAPLTAATEKNVADEMRHELAFENHRWTDLIRTGKAVEVMTQHGVEIKTLYPWILPIAFNVNENKLIYPFPEREIAVNKYLTQNPGY